MAKVTVRKGEDVNRAIRRFKRKVEREGIMRDLKKKRYYSKPSILNPLFEKKKKELPLKKEDEKQTSEKLHKKDLDNFFLFQQDI